MILSRKYGIALILVVIIFIPNVCAIKVSVSNGDGTSYSGDYRLDKSTSLQNNILLASEGIFQERQASGSGNNAIIQSIGGDDYSGKSSLITSGSFSSSTSSVVTSNAGTVSQDVSVNGDAAIGVSASIANDAVSQQAGVDNGVLTSSQSLAVGGSSIASQNTAITGDSGTIYSSALSDGHQAKTFEGYFEGVGNLDAQTASMSDGYDTGMQATASFNGIKLINAAALSEIAAEGRMSLEGLYDSKSGGIGNFGMNILNTKSDKLPSRAKDRDGISSTSTVAGKIQADGSHPEIIKMPLGDSKSYVLNNGNIDASSPIQLYLRSDTYLKNEGLDQYAAAQAISSAANTWDYWTKPGQNNLFKPAVIIDASKLADKSDGYSTLAFIPIDGTFIAYARTTYAKSGKNINIKETDICLDTDRQWTTDANSAQNIGTYDLQSVALHELGHACGLGDLYNLPNGDPRRIDLNEIMNRYAGLRHSLGAGDIAGIRAKYGA